MFVCLNDTWVLQLTSGFVLSFHRSLGAADINYLPGEDVQKIHVGSSKQLVLSSQPSFSSDVFAYGTIAYELMTLERPYNNLPLVDLIWKLGNHDYQSLEGVAKGRFRSVISRCWSQQASKRPTFKKTLTMVQDDSKLGKFSSVQFHNYSVPSHLCSMGVFGIN